MANKHHTPLTYPSVHFGLTFQLDSCRALNGKRGIAIDFGCSKVVFLSKDESDDTVANISANRGRYTVKLDGPEGRLIKAGRAHVRGVDSADANEVD